MKQKNDVGEGALGQKSEKCLTRPSVGDFGKMLNVDSDQRNIRSYLTRRPPLAITGFSFNETLRRQIAKRAPGHQNEFSSIF